MHAFASIFPRRPPPPLPPPSSSSPQMFKHKFELKSNLREQLNQAQATGLC